MNGPKDDVVNIVHEALTVYDADRTGLFDFALESAGGTIASTRCTETYDVTQVNSVYLTFATIMRRNDELSWTMRTDPKYQQKSKFISSAEPNYF